MKIAVCDDDTFFLGQAEHAVKRWAEEQDLTVELQLFDNGDSLLTVSRTEQFDVLLLDIMMPLFNGMELAHVIRETNTAVKIVFLTSSPEFAVESYDVKASGYLLKPLQYEKLCSVLDDCKAPQDEESPHIIAKIPQGYHKIYLSEIECLEAQNKKTIFHLCSGKVQDALGTFSNYAKPLTIENGFFKCHRSYIVSIPQVDHFNTAQIRTRSGMQVPIARGYGKESKKYISHTCFKRRPQMTEMLLDGLRHLLTLLFGIGVSAAFLDVAPTRKNIVILSVFSALDFIVLCILFLLQSDSVTYAFYPLLTHMPLVLLFTLAFKCRLAPSVLAVLTAYLCCQISNWISTIPQTFHCPDWSVDITYIIVLIIISPFVWKYVASPIAKLLSKPASSLISFGIVPVSYYIFDYASTVYTKLLYAGNHITVEFPPFLLCISYLIFCAIYFKQYEEKQEAENHHRFMKLKQEQSEREMTAIRRSEHEISLLRHDMRHFLATVSDQISNGETEKAQETIHRVIASVEKTTRRKYSSNETINMILSCCEADMAENRIDFQHTIRIPKVLTVSDVDLTSILSNALENAIHAASSVQDPKKRIIRLSMIESGDKLLISLKNTCSTPLALKAGCL
ncbi:MAG: response regulator [Clostridia bacterium]